MNARNIFRSSAAVADEIARRVELEEARKSESLLAEAEQLANLGSWEHDLETGEETWSANLCRILGAGTETRKFSRDVFWDLVHPDDREMVWMLIECGMKERQPYEYQARFVLPDGRERILLTRGKPVVDSANRIIKRVGFTQDVTITVEGLRALLESEERYRDLVENSHDLICTYDMDGVLLSVNELPARILGYKREELVGRSMSEFLAAEVRKKFGESFKRIEREGSVNGLMVLMTRSGEKRIWEYTNTLRTEGVLAPIVRGMAHDVTERFNAQMALHDSQARLNALVESIDDVVIELDLEGRVLDIWTTRPELLFCPREEQIGRRVSEIIGPDFFRPFAGIFKRVLLSGRSEELEYPLSLGVGERWFVARVTPIMATDGTYKSVCLLVRDITARKQAEQKLLKQERLQAQAEELAGLGSWESNEQTGEVTWSPQQCRNLGVDPQETPPTVDLFWKLLHTEDRERVRLDSEKAIIENSPYDYEARFVCPDGRTRVLHIRGLPSTDSSGQAVRWVGMSQDITERKRTEEELSLFRTLIDQSNDAIEVVDPDTLRFLDMNQKGCADLGYTREEILSRTVFDVDPTVDDAAFTRGVEYLRKSGFFIKEGVHRRKDGTTFPVEISTKLIQLKGKRYIVTVARDITERKVVEETLRRQEASLQSLLSISNKLNASLDVNVILNCIVREAAILADARSGGSATIGPNGPVGNCFFDEATGKDSTITWDLRDSASSWVLEHKLPYLSNDAANDPRVSAFAKEALHLRHVLVIPITDSAGNVIAIVGVHNKRNGQGFTAADQDSLMGLAGISGIALENAIAYRKIRCGEAQLQNLSRQLLTLQDNERQRIAFHLHESVAQDLVGLRLCLGQLRQSAGALPESLRQVINQAMKISHTMVQDLRTLSYSLHPPRFEQTGLATAV
jgi:PAS domain S-box-containing protein